MRSGAAWDVLAALGLLLPLASLAVGDRVGADRRPWVTAGVLVATVGLWTVLLAVGAAPALGAWSPDPVAMAAAAGAALLAAFAPGGVVPPAAASLVAFAAGAWDQPVDLGSALGAALVVAGVVGAAATSWRGPNLGVVAGLFVALRGAAAFRGETPTAVGVALAVVAAAVAVLGARGTIRPAPAAVVSLVAGAVALAPIPEVRSWTALVAAGAVVVATEAGSWVPLACAPGVAVVATAASDVPAGSTGALAHAMWALGAATAVVAVVPVSERSLPTSWTPASVVAAGVTAWLVVAPGSWRWAVADPRPLAPWDRAAAVALAAAAVAGVGAALGRAREGRRPTPAG